MPSNPSRVWLDREIAVFAGQLSPGALVLDAGAGDQRYAHHFAHCRYETADFEKVDKAYGKTTYVCDLVNIPVERERFDAVVLTQVMEHLPDPAAALGELNRVLKPEGLILYTGPLQYEEHEVPHDYFRFTQYALRLMFTRADFEILELRWLAGYFATVTHQLRRMRRALPRKRDVYGPGLSGLLFFLTTGIFRRIAKSVERGAAKRDVAERYTETGSPLNYLVVARKPPRQT